MKKFLLILLAFLMLSNVVFAFEAKDEMYYKRQIQNQRFLYSTSGLINAINKGNSEVVEDFMMAGFNPNEICIGIAISYMAIKSENTNILEILLKHGADVNASSVDCNLVIWTIHYKNSEAVQLLITHGLDVNKKFKNKTPLNYAIQTKQTKIAEILLKAGAKPDEKTYKMVNKSKDEYLKDLFSNNKNEK